MRAATPVKDGAAVSRGEDRSRTNIRDGRDWRGLHDRFHLSDFVLDTCEEAGVRKDTSLDVEKWGGAEAPPVGG